MKENKNFENLGANYLFPQIAKRKKDFEAAFPTARVISLGIGNTTEPLPVCVAKAMSEYALSLASAAGYSGYGDDGGDAELRALIAKRFYSEAGCFDISADDIFVSDGAKCDIARLQVLFGKGVKVYVQDPAYPVYVDGSLIMGVEDIERLPCNEENGFFPDLSKIEDGSVIYFCSPNNPTGATTSREDLTKLVNYALVHGCVIVFDAAYNQFIRDPKLPRSIFEIPEAARCAIEVNSFSKPAGFTGVRLGWSAVSKKLKWGDKKDLQQSWLRVQTTLFNCASNIAQAGGKAALSEEGLKEMKRIIDYYLANARAIEKALKSKAFENVIEKVFYTGNSPYLWVKFSKMTSWEAFDKILNKCHIVTTPGSGFGEAGEHYLRFSAFGHKENVEEACKRLEEFKM